MPSINLNTGYKDFDINGDPDRIIRFAPTDTGFIERLYRAFETLEKKQDEYRRLGNEAKEPEEVFALVHRADSEIRGIIDGCFDVPVCDTVFGSVSLYTVTDGMPLWCAFLVAILSECDETFTAQQKVVNPKLQALMKKYKKK